MIATIAAYLAKPLIKWGIIAAVIGGLTIWALWERNDAIASAKGEAAAKLESDLHAQDAARNQSAINDRDRIITGLADQLNAQSAMVEQGRARESQLRTSLDAARKQNDDLQQQADQLSRDLDAETAKAPGDVREVGPIVAKRVQQLFE